MLMDKYLIYAKTSTDLHWWTNLNENMIVWFYDNYITYTSISAMYKKYSLPFRKKKNGNKNNK